MRLLVTGANGLLGSNIMKTFSDIDAIDLIGTDISDTGDAQKGLFIKGDLLDNHFVNSLVYDQRPEVIINTVALPDVERCENDRNFAYKINVETAINIAKASVSAHCRLLHISTDQLFRGDMKLYSEEAIAEPINYYGKSKLEAEHAICYNANNSAVIRTNFYGWGPMNHPVTFGEWLYTNLKNQENIRLFTDIFYTPIEISYLVNALFRLAKSDYCGIINIAGSERCSKYEFGLKMATEFGFGISNIQESSSESISNRTPRPKDMSLSIEKYKMLFGPLPNVVEGLHRFHDAAKANNGNK